MHLICQCIYRKNSVEILSRFETRIQCRWSNRPSIRRRHPNLSDHGNELRECPISHFSPPDFIRPQDQLLAPPVAVAERGGPQPTISDHQRPSATISDHQRPSAMHSGLQKPVRRLLLLAQQRKSGLCVLGHFVAIGKFVQCAFTGCACEVVQGDFLTTLQLLTPTMEVISFAAFLTGDCECHKIVGRGVRDLSGIGRVGTT